MEQEGLLQKRMQSRIIVAPNGKKRPNLAFSDAVRVSASDICLYGILEMLRLIALRTGYIHEAVQWGSKVPGSLQTSHACVVLHRLDGFRKGTQCANIVSSCHAVQRGNQGRPVRQAKP